jgi:hypothetical protein
LDRLAAVPGVEILSIDIGLEETTSMVATNYIPLCNLNTQFFNRLFPHHRKVHYNSFVPWQADTFKRQDQFGGVSIHARANHDTPLQKIIIYPKVTHTIKAATESDLTKVPNNIASLRNSLTHMTKVKNALTAQGSKCKIIRMEFRINWMEDLRTTLYLVYLHLTRLRKCLIIYELPFLQAMQVHDKVRDHFRPLFSGARNTRKLSQMQKLAFAACVSSLGVSNGNFNRHFRTRDHWNVLRRLWARFHNEFHTINDGFLSQLYLIGPAPMHFIGGDLSYRTSINPDLEAAAADPNQEAEEPAPAAHPPLVWDDSSSSDEEQFIPRMPEEAVLEMPEDVMPQVRIEEAAVPADEGYNSEDRAEDEENEREEHEELDQAEITAIEDIVRRAKFFPYRVEGKIQARRKNGAPFKAGLTREAIAGAIFERFGLAWETEISVHTNPEDFNEIGAIEHNTESEDSDGPVAFNELEDSEATLAFSELSEDDESEDSEWLHEQRNQDPESAESEPSEDSRFLTQQE